MMPAPARITVLPLPDGSQIIPSRGEKLLWSPLYGELTCAPTCSKPTFGSKLPSRLLRSLMTPLRSYRNPAFTVKWLLTRQSSCRKPPNDLMLTRLSELPTKIRRTERLRRNLPERCSHYRWKTMPRPRTGCGLSRIGRARYRCCRGETLRQTSRHVSRGYRRYCQQTGRSDW